MVYQPSLPPLQPRRSLPRYVLDKAPYGLNLSNLHPSSPFSYTNRSCNRFCLPCQNSTLSGTTLNPPQNSGTGTSSTPSNRFSASLTHPSNSPLPSSSSPPTG